MPIEFAAMPKPEEPKAAPAVAHVIEHMPDQLPVHSMQFLSGPPITDYQGPFASVRLGAGLTIEVRKFEFVRPEVFVTVPCHPNELDNAAAFAWDWSNAKLTEMRKLILEAMKGPASAS